MYFATLHSNVLVCNMQLLMNGVDMLYQDTNRLVSYEKNIAKQMQMKQQFIQKRVSHAMPCFSVKLQHL